MRLIAVGQKLMEVDTIGNENVFQRLQNRIARLKRRVDHLERISARYWRARRLILACGIFLTLAFCRYSGQLAGWVGLAHLWSSS